MEARYQNQIAKLTQSLQQHDMERLKMEEERKEKEKELELLREEVEGLKRESEGLKRESEGLKKESEGFKEEMGEKEEQLIQMKHEIEEWREKADRLNVELKGKSERNEGIEELDRMKTENESLKTELNEMKKENESLKGELKNVQMENETEELNQCIEELERVKQENESLRAELERGKEGVAMAETIALKEELDNLNKVNASLREELIKLSAERKNLLNPLLSHQLPRGYQIDLNEFNEFNDQQSLEGEPDFRTHPPEQFFYSSPLPTSSSSLEAYRLVISQLYREVLSLQRENQSLVAQLDAAKPLQITITPPGMEESNAGVKSLIASMQMTMQTLQVTLKEKNDLIAKLNAQLQQFLSDSHPNGEFSLDQREVETENMLNSEEQTESEGEEEQSQQPQEPQHKEEEEDQRDQEDQEDQKDQEEEEGSRENAPVVRAADGGKQREGKTAGGAAFARAAALRRGRISPKPSLRSRRKTRGTANPALSLSPEHPTALHALQRPARPAARFAIFAASSAHSTADFVARRNGNNDPHDRSEIRVPHKPSSFFSPVNLVASR